MLPMHMGELKPIIEHQMKLDYSKWLNRLKMSFRDVLIIFEDSKNVWPDMAHMLGFIHGYFEEYHFVLWFFFSLHYMNCPQIVHNQAIRYCSWKLRERYCINSNSFGNSSSGNYTNHKILMALSTMKHLSTNYQHWNCWESLNYRWYSNVENTP